jgi:hypothetical protein
MLLVQIIRKMKSFEHVLQCTNLPTSAARVTALQSLQNCLTQLNTPKKHYRYHSSWLLAIATAWITRTMSPGTLFFPVSDSSSDSICTTLSMPDTMTTLAISSREPLTDDILLLLPFYYFVFGSQILQF